MQYIRGSMLAVSKLKSLILFLIIGNSFLLSAGLSGKKFDVETGVVLFKISGGGQLTDDVNISIKGEGKLRFKDWGVMALVEENYEEITTGVIKDINKIQICEKFEDKQRFDVDFETEKILERPMPKGNFRDYYLNDMLKTGEEMIAGYPCDVWEGKGVKKCLHKGVPLLVEHYLFGVYYQKKAVDVKFNIKTKPSKCMLPDFPVEKFALFKTNIKTKNNKLPKELSQIIIRVSKELNKYISENKLTQDDLNTHQKRIWQDKLGQNIFEVQKKFLPKFLETMKNARVCLQQVESANEANACILEVINMKKKVSESSDNTIASWDEKNKRAVLDTFDENIFILESKMKCIRGAENISDLSACMK